MKSPEVGRGVEYIEARWKGKWGRSCVQSDVMVKRTHLLTLK